MSKSREWNAFRNSMTLGEVDDALERMASSGWRLPGSEELSEGLEGEEMRLPLISRGLDMPIQWYWSSSVASESPHGGVREGIDADDKETRVVVKYHGGHQDSAIMRRYGTIFVRDC
jgi:hypothetical protein